MGDVWSWLLFFFIIIGIVVMVVFQLMCLADLEFDYINPYDSASRINKVILPEFITQGVLSFLFLVTGHWIMALLSIPYLYYNVTFWSNLTCIWMLGLPFESINFMFLVLLFHALRVISWYNRREHLIDVTEIFNMLNREKKKRLFKLGYLMLFLFMTLFWLIYSALEDDDHFT